MVFGACRPSAETLITPQHRLLPTSRLVWRAGGPIHPLWPVTNSLMCLDSSESKCSTQQLLCTHLGLYCFWTVSHLQSLALRVPSVAQPAPGQTTGHLLS